MLGVHIDSELNFNLHIDIVYRSASNQLNALALLKRYLGLEERFVLVKSFVMLRDLVTLQLATLLKVTLLHWRFSRFLNCTNGTKSRKIYVCMYVRMHVRI